MARATASEFGMTRLFSLIARAEVRRLSPAPRRGWHGQAQMKKNAAASSGGTWVGGLVWPG
jgi:hypothetical protein